MKEELNTSWVGKESPSKGILVQEKSGENLELKINPEFEKFIPPLREQELFMLKQSLWKEGCRDALITWRGTILDGHHRYKYCKEKGLPFKVIERDFSTEKEALIWMIINQLGRRNVIDFVRGEMALELKKLLREVAEEASKSQLKQFQVFDNEESTDWDICPSRRNKTQAEYDRDRVNAQIGEAAGLSYKKIYKIEKIKETATPEELEELRSGKKSINKKYTEIMRGKRQDNLKATEFPKGKYRVIYADPPWDYGSPFLLKYSYIIDGHHRYDICTRNKLSFRKEEREFESQNDVEIWIIENQFNRRNLPSFTRATLTFELEKRFKKRRGNRYTYKEIPRTVPYGTVLDTTEEPLRKAAKSTGMGHNTYAKCKFIDKHADEKTKEERHTV